MQLPILYPNLLCLVRLFVANQKFRIKAGDFRARNRIRQSGAIASEMPPVLRQ